MMKISDSYNPYIRQFLKGLNYCWLIVLITFYSCNRNEENSYAIKDFRKSLQPFLTSIVSEGTITYYDSAQIKGITDNELENLCKSESPILRAFAFREMLDRESFNHYNVIMNHLDDTAHVDIDAGEFGIWTRTVSDDILQEAIWDTKESKNKTIELVLSKHNYLRSAYRVLPQLDPQEKFYAIIKDMATRTRHFDKYEFREMGFGDIEYALYGLAKFKKREDVQIIKNKLLKHSWELSDLSFRLMKEFPDTAYFEVLQTYHRYHFYNFSGIRPNGFSGYIPDKSSPEDFIGALVAQQNEKSAKLIDTVLITLPTLTCLPDKRTIINNVIEQVWLHPCPAYEKLRKKIKTKAEAIQAMQIKIPFDTYSKLLDTTSERFRWYE